MRRFALLPALALVVASAPPARADEKGLPPDGWPIAGPPTAAEDGDFVTARGRACVVHSSAGPRPAADVARFVDGFLREFSRLFEGRFLIEEPLTVRVFAHAEEFSRRFQRAYPGRTAGDARAALYSPHLRETWILLHAGQTPPRRNLRIETAKHELTHHMLHLFTGQDRLPPWFNEGAACFFQYWDPAEDKSRNIAENLVRAGTGDYGYFPRVMKESLERDELLPLGELLALGYDGFHGTGQPVAGSGDLKREGRGERLHYSQSWALVNFLVSTPKGRRFFNVVLSALRGGRDLSREVPEETLASLERAWREDLAGRIAPAAR